MSLNLKQKVLQFLSERPGEAFTVREIANWIFQTFPEECRAKQSRSTALLPPLDTDQALVQQIVAEIHSLRSGLEKQHPQIRSTDGKPRRWSYSQITERLWSRNVRDLRRSLRRQTPQLQMQRKICTQNSFGTFGPSTKS